MAVRDTSFLTFDETWVPSDKFHGFVIIHGDSSLPVSTLKVSFPKRLCPHGRKE